MAVAVALSAGAAIADGMGLAPYPYRISEPVQRALLEFDAGTGVERLTIQPAFAGETDQFTWVVPLPALPAVEAADAGLFWSLERLTGARYESRDGEWDCLSGGQFEVDEPAAVTIVSQVLIGYYEARVIAADDAAALYDSLTAWGDLHAGNEAEVRDALAPYVDEGWYFAAVRVDSASYAAQRPYDPSRLYGPDPLRFTFAADRPVYPLRISALTATTVSHVHLYVVADHRMTFPGAETYYADAVEDDDAARLASYGGLADILRPGVFLTRLFRGYRPAEMTADVYPVRAPTDESFQLVRYAGAPWTTLLLLGPPGLWLVWRLGRRRWAGAVAARASGRPRR